MINAVVFCCDRNTRISAEFTLNSHKNTILPTAVSTDFGMFIVRTVDLQSWDWDGRGRGGMETSKKVGNLAGSGAECGAGQNSNHNPWLADHVTV